MFKKWTFPLSESVQKPGEGGRGGFKMEPEKYDEWSGHYVDSRSDKSKYSHMNTKK